MICRKQKLDKIDKVMNKHVRKFGFAVKDDQFKESSFTHRGGIINRCVSVARTPKGVALRDTKDAGKTTLFFTRNEWKAFTRGVKNSEFDL